MVGWLSGYRAQDGSVAYWSYAENPSQGNRMALKCSAPKAIRFVDLGIAGDVLDWPAVPCRPWLSRQATGLTLGQRHAVPTVAQS